MSQILPESSAQSEPIRSVFRNKRISGAYQGPRRVAVTPRDGP
jgi:hypothetical protein